MAETAPLKGASLREAAGWAAKQLEASGADTPMLDARLLLLNAAGLSQEDYIRDPQYALSDAVADRFYDCVQRRAAGEPVSRILGVREFYGREFGLASATLDPRPDTETLIEAVLKSVANSDAPITILDLGVGTGAILLTLLAELPGATGVGVDRSAEALTIARGNAQMLGLEDRVSFCCADWLAPLAGRFDLVVANPPYIRSSEIATLAREVRSHDPMLALDGGADGLDAYRTILGQAPDVLVPGGQLFFEVGDDQAESVCGLMAEAGLRLDGQASVWSDLAGKARCVAGKREVRRSGAVQGRDKKGLGTVAASG